MYLAGVVDLFALVSFPTEFVGENRLVKKEK